MCENSDQALLFGEAIFNDLVADEKRLHGRLGDIDHVALLGKVLKVKRFLIAQDNTWPVWNSQGTMGGKRAPE